MRRAEALRDQLEQDIVTGHFRPGERLDEQSLATRFGVSRTPIREALMQLASTGMVELQPRRGAFVASLSLRAVVERFEAMAALEGMCGALAARRITDAQRSTLVTAHEACEAATRAGCADTYYYANERFHRAIYEACHNQYLAEQAGQLHTLLKPYRRLQLRARHRVGQSLAEHGAIVAAILAGDSGRAEQSLREHILIQGERLNDFISSFGTADVA
ncbi:AsnC family transcriptional regulator [Methylobacterium sp. Leaf456]|uniref:GntR family transcriptional regulator n=1 Tax=Methylobacterium sp. Leaf456 TaxID=1736382 RepID=UPI0006F99EA4|nr:GntR family transcriptional regulator [Methylobacterium sp. Leaf456]KQT61668.1 AsnC family transcriptional regulator [Methylobacterium sp. Leaf456]